MNICLHCIQLLTIIVPVLPDVIEEHRFGNVTCLPVFQNNPLIMELNQVSVKIPLYDLSSVVQVVWQTRHI